MKKIAIYDRYLSTAGGGERYSCKMAEILSTIPEYSVHLVTDLFADLDNISRKLNLDMSKVELKIFPYISDDYTRQLTEEYDLFINATYLSALPSYGKKNIYLCYFPTPFDIDFGFLHRLLLIFFRIPALWLFGLAGKLTNGFSGIEIEEGLYDPKRFMLYRGSWTSGTATLTVDGDQGFRLGIKNPSQSLLEDMEVKISAYPADDRTGIMCKPVFEYETVLEKGEIKLINPGFCKDKPYRIIVNTDTFIPSSGGKTSRDSRKLGAVLYNRSRTSIFRKVILKIIGYMPLFLVTYPRDFKFLDSYQKIISISGYSSYWIRKYWDRKSTILFPPVDTSSFSLEKNDIKEKVILSVGRFFPEHHNKKQYELAKAFIDLSEKYPEDMKGYSLYLAGGVENRPGHREYVERIKELARGYPVKLMTNISFKELTELFKKAFIFWHASGLGEDEEMHPEKFEHFGITTVEAMSAGCIPVVINRGGQKEIVEDGINGFVFNDLEELKKKTINIIRGNIDQEDLRDNAISGSSRFSNERFARDLISIVRDMINAGKEPEK